MNATFNQKPLWSRPRVLRSMLHRGEMDEHCSASLRRADLEPPRGSFVRGLRLAAASGAGCLSCVARWFDHGPVVPDRGSDEKSCSAVLHHLRTAESFPSQNDDRSNSPNEERAVAASRSSTISQGGQRHPQQHDNQCEVEWAVHESAQAQRRENPRIRRPTGGTGDARQQRSSHAGRVAITRLNGLSMSPHRSKNGRLDLVLGG